MANGYRHFHLRFISAGLGIGLGMTFGTVSFTQAASWGDQTRVAGSSWLIAVVALMVASTILVFSWHEIQSELRHAHRH